MAFEKYEIIPGIIDSLELCAELNVDVTADVYNKFFNLCPDAIETMGHSDEHMKGRMVDQVFELLMDNSHEGPGGYLRWEVDNHLEAYAVDVNMYPAFFSALRDAVRARLGSQWSTLHAYAWEQRINALLSDINKHANTAA